MACKKTRIMYIEQKTGDNAGGARIGRVQFSRTGRTLYYRDKAFMPVGGRGIYGNYYGYDRAIYEAFVNAELTELRSIPGFLGEFWISGPKRNGRDQHSCERSGSVQVDEDVADDYWKVIRRIDRISGTQARE
jgi:hypothetical protein